MSNNQSFNGKQLIGQINTDSLSLKYRSLAVDLKNKKILMTNFYETEQEQDFKEPSNCNGFGRIRHFNRSASEGWPQNSLPIEPACNALDIPNSVTIRAQVFQNAVCNWRCWYCYVPFKLLSADPSHSSWMSASELTDLYLNQENPPKIIDLSGGQPDLVPEWIPWMMSELIENGLEKTVYLWSDDNLSNDYFWKYLSSKDIELIKSYKNYGKVCCFKGFDDESFSFNTMAHRSLFDRQFDLMKKFLTLGIDLYAYVTLTAPVNDQIPQKIHDFVDRLQELDFYLPLRTIPLEIKIYTPMNSRMNNVANSAIKYQQIAIKSWQSEIKSRYSDKELGIPIHKVPLCGVR